MAILAEFLGGIGLLLGLFSRVAAFGIAIIMIVAVSLVHAQNGSVYELGRATSGERALNITFWPSP